MNTGRYKSYTRADAAQTETGYVKAWLSLKSDFDTLNEPVVGVTPDVGDAYEITAAHEWTEDKEALAIYVKADSIDAPGESTGEVGSQRMLWKPKIFIVGDGPVTLELVNNFLNEELIIFVQDQCGQAKYIQFGCDCMPAMVEKNTFTSGTLSSGAKGYEMTCRTFTKYFYNAAITERA